MVCADRTMPIGNRGLTRRRPSASHQENQREAAQETAVGRKQSHDLTVLLKKRLGHRRVNALEDRLPVLARGR